MRRLDDFSRIIAQDEKENASVTEEGSLLYVHFPSCRSTHLNILEHQERYCEFLADGKRGIIVTTDHQYGGVGCEVQQRHRHWDDLGKENNIKLSLVVGIEHVPAESLTASCGLLVAKIITQFLRRHGSAAVCKSKWPNDLVIENKKVGGILVTKLNQKQKNVYTIGMGINVVRGSDLPTAGCLSSFVSPLETIAEAKKELQAQICQCLLLQLPPLAEIALLIDKYTAFLGQKVKFMPDRGAPENFQVGFLRSINLKSGCLRTSIGDLKCETIEPLEQLS